MREDVKSLILDLDGCLYPAHRLYDIFDRATANAGLTLGLKMSFDEALKINQEAQARGELFPLAYIEGHGISLPDLHREYHNNLDAEALIAPNPALVEAFQRLGGRHAVLTHGNRDWADRVLRRIGIRDFFPDSRIVALEDCGYVMKTDEEKPFLIALERVGQPPEHTAMVEDSHRNLIIPHRMGMATALVHYGTPRQSLPDHVHIQHETPIVLIDALLRMRQTAGA